MRATAHYRSSSTGCAATQTLARTLPVSKAVVLSRSDTRRGSFRWRTSARRSSRSAAIARAWNLLPGTTDVHLPRFNLGARDAMPAALEALWRDDRIDERDAVPTALAAVTMPLAGCSRAAANTRAAARSSAAHCRCAAAFSIAFSAITREQFGIRSFSVAHRIGAQTIAHVLTHIKQMSWIPLTQLSRNRP
ncbi:MULTISPECIES: hypothetical protein [Burkholderia]|uniref:Uncharacterized protein n=2 Tax=Burkholderia pseudomallei TaxID=28450 RepID=A0AAX0U2U1_BURPE|nr:MULTISPECIES: hypothetical protein [Burkholderia]ABN88720.1 hypothetical protein BURPS1106A_0761 [Burkholderia pseudomallei 1106a]AFR14637.1 hypothetical protein BPC006_I0749 [Burkholderia pseudomallei BPC006]ARK48412.1 hypothetical protein BOC35_19160 [Burkholderia pseudomallei]ARK54699.1 hypothetical protein BOC36_17360 [Burkholderia pseudomallei]ARK62193.1 hypothetical protein BOC37_19945 [Burkholderia pseudomallei]